MVQIAAGRRVAAALAVAALISWHGAAGAQQSGGPGDINAPLDPSAPLDPLPGIGVDWPNMEEQPEADIAQTPDASIADTATEHAYDVRLEGLDAVAPSDLVIQFHQLSGSRQ